MLPHLLWEGIYLLKVSVSYEIIGSLKEGLVSALLISGSPDLKLLYRKCLKQRLAHGKYPEMLARIIITTTTIILCYFPIQLRKEGDMDSKKCNPSTMRMLKFISWVGGETKAQKGSVRGRPTAPFRVHEKEAPGLTARQEHRVDSSPCSPPRPGDLFSQLLAQLSQDGPTSRPPNKEVSLLREHDLHHTVTAYIR